MYRLQCQEEEITRGQRILLDCLDHRQLREFCRKHDLSFVYMFRIAVGGIPVSTAAIYALRNEIAPVLWFYRENERLPPSRSYKDAGAKKWDFSKSIGYNKFVDTVKPDALTWCRKNGFAAEYRTYIMIHHGERAPSFSKMMQLKKIIYPADWFFTVRL